MSGVWEPDRDALRVLWITNTWDGSYRYRCQQGAQQLRGVGVAANVYDVGDPELLAALPSYSVVVLFRLPWTSRVAHVVDAVRTHGATPVFEIDDLIFDPEVEPLLPFLADLTSSAQREYRDRFERLRRTFDACDRLLGSTPAVVRRAAALGKPTLLHPNLLSPYYERVARITHRLGPLRRRPPTIAYISGSNTHDRDLAMVSEPLARVLHDQRDARLFMCGFVDLPPALRPFADRVQQIGYQDWRVYPWALATCRVKIAPVSAVNDFTDAKSPLKFFEAGIFAIPTVASPTETLADAITDGVDGFLAADDAEWDAKLRLALDGVHGRRVGRAARDTVRRRFTFGAHRGALVRMLAPIAGRATGPRPALLSLDPAARGHARAEAETPLQRGRRSAAFFLGRPAPETRPPAGAGAAVAVPLAPDRFEACLATLDERGDTWLSDDPTRRTLARGVDDWSTWEVGGEVTAARPGGWVAADRDPQLASPPLRILPRRFRYLVLRLRATAAGGTPWAQLFWSGPGVGFTEGNSVRWQVEADGEWRTHVVDLADTTWRAFGTVTGLRLDPLDRPGEFALGAMTLVADLAQLEGGDVRWPLARRHLRGIGVECGALQNPLRVPDDAKVIYVDRLTEADARAHYPELAGQRIVGADVVSDVHRLPIREGAVDFLIGNHLLEHARDPIAAIQQMLDVVRPGGLLYVSVPDVGNPLDRRRRVTPFEHLLDDHDATRDRRTEDRAHYDEYVHSAHHALAEADRTGLIERFVAQDYSIHFHTFDEPAFRRLLAHVGERAGARVVEFARNRGAEFDEYVAVLQRTAPLRRVRPAPPAPPVDVVVPVYGALEETLACLESVRRHATGDWRLVVVDDASPDPALRTALDALAAADARVQVLRNPENRGFVHTANRGLAAAGDRDVVLLNSDTVVTEGFLDGLRAAAYHAPMPSIASPLSNNATICSVPEWCRANPLPPGQTIDRFAALIRDASLALHPPLVSAHGFCMYVPAAVRRAVGLFDEEHFDRGFGEENDYCERALARGFGIRLADEAFVYHAGGASFGDDAEALREAHYETLRRLHPTYFPRVARFIEENPLQPVHHAVRLALHRPRATSPALLCLLHASFDEPGGGTEHHVRDLLQAARLPRALVAVPETDGIHVTEIFDGQLGGAVRYLFPLDEPPVRFMLERADFEAALERIVRLFDVRAVHLHQLCNWPIGLWRTLQRLGVPYVATFQDFFPACPNVNLWDEGTEALCCLGDATTAESQAACLRRTCTQFGVEPFDDPLATLARHRAEFRPFIEGAEAVFFPAERTRAIMGRFFDLARTRAAVVPHGYLEPSRRVTHQPPGHRRLNVALLGAIAHPIKGSRSYLKLLAATTRLPITWHVFGSVDHQDYRTSLQRLGLGNRLRLHGWYRREQIFDRLAAAQIDLVVFLPPWPETFSYTLSEALCAGVPIVVTDQGALRERVEAAGAGIVVQNVEEAIAALEALVREPAALQALQRAAADFRHRSIEEMAAVYRPRYDAMLARGPAQPAPSPEDRRELLAAYDAAQPTAAPAAPPVPKAFLPHYSRPWYRYYEPFAGLVPLALRRWARERTLASWWRPVRTYRFGGRHQGVEWVDGLELVRASSRRSVHRVVGRDPFFVFSSQPFSPREVRMIRFEMRHSADGARFAQLYWSHRTGEVFSEEKSVLIPLEIGATGWRQYTLCIDDTDRRFLWDDGAEIHHLRFDPVDKPGTIELEALHLCAARDDA